MSLLGRIHRHVVDRRTRRADLSGVVAVHVHGAVAVTHVRSGLGVGGAQVQALVEGLLRDLPVAAQLLRHVRLDVAVLEVPHAEVLGQRAEEVLQRLGVRIRVDEDEPAPGADLGLGQLPGVPVGLDLGELVGAGHVAQRPVQLPGEAVERAAELAAPAVEVLECPPAVQAGVDVGLDGALAGAGHQVGVTGDLVDHVAADLGEVLLAAGHLPHAPPQVRPLEFVPGAAGVALHRDVLRARRVRDPFAQVLHRRPVVLEYEVVPAQTRRALLARYLGDGHGAPGSLHPCRSGDVPPPGRSN